jgi:tRNA (guanine-N7-)-methyltransferase
MPASGEADDAPGASKRRALYGRSKGKTLRTYHARLVSELLPKLELAGVSLAEPARLFDFAPDRLELEIGFGGGEHLAQRAEEAPTTGFIGCEPFINGVAKLLSTVDGNHLANIRIRCGDARELVERLPAACLERIYILYPDPWPKRRQHKRRLISPEMINQLARVLRPCGELRFATDIDDYSGWTLKRFLDSADFEWLATKADDWRQPWEGWRPTRYEAKARAEGRGSAYLSFRRRPSLAPRPAPANLQHI